jgi:hypothetical protein
MKLPEHKAGLFLTHNEHRGYYLALDDFLQNQEVISGALSPEDVKQCVEADSLWVLQWYPCTPVAFRIVAASTLEEVLKRAMDVEAATT